MQKRLNVTLPPDFKLGGKPVNGVSIVVGSEHTTEADLDAYAQTYVQNLAKQFRIPVDSLTFELVGGSV